MGFIRDLLFGFGRIDWMVAGNVAGGKEIYEGPLALLQTSLSTLTTLDLLSRRMRTKLRCFCSFAVSARFFSAIIF
jgi:hypothetical protein